MKLVPKKPKNKPTWTDLKKSLAELDRAGLLGLIQDLYAADKNNKIFLNTRFGLGDDQLEPYKKIISRWVRPDVPSTQEISVAGAKKAISDYKKAIGCPEELAELIVFYCEESVSFLSSCGMNDEGYFDALVNMFERALKATINLEKQLQAPFVERLNRVCNRSRNFGYGVFDDMGDSLCDFGFLEE
jgi:hypothetical protein